MEPKLRAALSFAGVILLCLLFFLLWPPIAERLFVAIGINSGEDAALLAFAITLAIFLPFAALTYFAGSALGLRPAAIGAYPGKAAILGLVTGLIGLLLTVGLSHANAVFSSPLRQTSPRPSHLA